MAIIKKTKSEGPTIPQTLAALVERAARFQTISGLYEDGFRAVKERIVAYLSENPDGFSVEMSKGVKTEVATIIYQSRENWSINTDMIVDMVKTGALSLETVLNIAKIDAKKLRDCVGNEKFATLATSSSTEYLTVKPIPAFKAQIEAAVSLDVEPTTASTSPAPAAPKASAPAKPATPKAPAPQADADLDSILKG